MGQCAGYWKNRKQRLVEPVLPMPETEKICLEKEVTDEVTDVSEDVQTEEQEISEEVMQQFIERYELGSLLEFYTEDKQDYVYKGRDKEFQAIFRIFAKSERNNVVLTGPYGSGKDAIANGIAEQIKKETCPPLFRGWDMICLDMSIFLDSQYSETFEERIRLLEELIYCVDKLIVYIKNVEAILANNLQHAFLNVFSCNRRMDGVRVITILDPEFCSKNAKIFLKDYEADTFEIVAINPPKEETLYHILKKRIDELSIIHQVKVEEREFKKVCNEVIRINQGEIQLDSILDTLDSALSIAKLDGLEKLDYHSIYSVYEGAMHTLMLQDEESRRLVAEHEAAHALVSVLTNRPTISVTIIANDTNLGYTTFQVDQLMVYSEKELYNRLAMLMAPYALNYRIKNRARHDDTTGDRKSASIVALEMVLSYSMTSDSKVLGECMAYSEEIVNRIGLPEGHRETVIKEVEAILQKSIDIATHLLEANMEKHALLAKALLRNASLTGEEARDLIVGAITLEDLPDPRLDEFA